MQFGICSSFDTADAAKAAGWAFVEENVQTLLRGGDPAWQAPTGADSIPAANSMVPGNLKIVGPDAEREPLLEYMTRVLQRAPQVGMKTIVFGSGAARNVPDGWDRSAAVAQITAFLRAIAPVAQQHDVTIVIEPLNRSECNIINTVAEAMTYVRAIDQPNIRCLVDSYHMWLENEPLMNIEAAMPWIHHVHVADRDGRVAPGESGTSDYKSFFAVLKRAGYGNLISVECRGLDLSTNAPRALEYLQENWNNA